MVPCRVFDTRYQQGGSGSINAGDTKLFTIAGYASQVVLGGADSDCGMLGLYDEVAALAINITVIEPLSAGWITAYPGGQAKPVVQQLISKRVTLLEMRLLLKHHKLTQLILPYSPLAKLT